MFRYPARIGAAGPGYTVSFRDIPEASTSGASLEEVCDMAADALATAMDFYFDDKRPVPLPSRPRRGEEWIELPANLAAKVLLRNEMLAQRVSLAELARRLHTRAQDVQKVIDLAHVTKIDTIASAFAALGKRLELSVVPA
jgi:antitoxin HicB